MLDATLPLPVASCVCKLLSSFDVVTIKSTTVRLFPLLHRITSLSQL